MIARAERRVQASVATALCAAALAAPVRTHESRARRAANIVSVAVEDYANGVDDRNQVVSAEEYAAQLLLLALVAFGVVRSFWPTHSAAGPDGL